MKKYSHYGSVVPLPGFVIESWYGSFFLDACKAMEIKSEGIGE